MSQVFKTVSKIFLYIALLSPLIIVNNFFFPFIGGKFLLFRVSVELAAIFFILFLAFGKNVPSWKFVSQPLVVAITVFAIIFLITSLAGVSPWTSFWSNFERGEGIFQFFHYIAFFLLTLFLFQSVGDWKRFLTFHSIVVLLVLAYGFFQLLQRAFGIHSFAIFTGRVSGTLGNPSYLAPYLMFSIFFAAWLFTQAKQKSLRWFWGVVIVIESFMLFTTETLAAIFGFIVAFFILALFYLQKIYHFVKTSSNKNLFFGITYLVSFLIIILFAGYFYFFGSIDLYHRLRPRLWTWGSAISGIIERPIFGWGAEAFPEVFDKYYNPNHFGGESWFDRTHNIFLEYLISGGIVLLLTYLTIFFFYYKKLFAIRRLNNISFAHQSWLWPLLFVIPIAYFIQGLTLFDVLPIYLTLFLFLAFFIHYADDFSHNVLVSITDPRWVFVLKAISFVWLIFVIYLLYFGNYLPLRKNLLIANALRTQNVERALVAAEQALAFHSPVGQQEAYESIGRNFVIQLQDLEKQKVKLSPENQALQQVMKINKERFEEIRPRLFGIKDYYLYGIWNISAYNLTGEKQYLERGKTILEEAFVKAPNRIEVIVALLDITRIEKNPVRQQELLKRLQALRPDLVTEKPAS